MGGYLFEAWRPEESRSVPIHTEARHAPSSAAGAGWLLASETCSAAGCSVFLEHVPHLSPFLVQCDDCICWQDWSLQHHFLFAQCVNISPAYGLCRRMYKHATRCKRGIPSQKEELLTNKESLKADDVLKTGCPICIGDIV